jgi:hypothetical protein
MIINLKNADIVQADNYWMPQEKCTMWRHSRESGNPEISLKNTGFRVKPEMTAKMLC